MVTITHDHAARRRSYELLAAEFGLRAAALESVGGGERASGAGPPTRSARPPQDGPTPAWTTPSAALVPSPSRLGAVARPAPSAQCEKAAPEVVRNALAQTSKVQGAPQRTLVLSRVVVNPGAKLALHHHLGTQIAQIESGTLTYTVERGSAVVSEGEADQNPRRRAHDRGRADRQGPRRPVDRRAALRHPRAANRGSVPVVIYLATLLKTGAPPSTPVVLGED